MTTILYCYDIQYVLHWNSLVCSPPTRTGKAVPYTINTTHKTAIAFLHKKDFFFYCGHWHIFYILSRHPQSCLAIKQSRTITLKYWLNNVEMGFMAQLFLCDAWRARLSGAPSCTWKLENMLHPKTTFCYVVYYQFPLGQYQGNLMCLILCLFSLAITSAHVTWIQFELSIVC